MPRLFTALEIPREIAFSLSMLRGGLPGARWIDPENYHLTLRFIGDVDDVLAHEIASLLDQVDRPAFELRFDRLASFGGRRPRAVIAAAAPVAPLVELQAELERLMQRMGLEPEGRKFTPHVMLARWACGFLSAQAPQNTPTIAELRSSTRLVGIFGISPAAKPMTRNRPLQASARTAGSA